MPKSLEPNKACFRPCAGSTVDCNFVNANPTLDIDSRFVKLSVEISDTDDKASFMLFTNAEIWLPKSPRFLFPVIAWSNPCAGSTVDCNLAKMSPTFAIFSIVVVSTPPDSLSLVDISTKEPTRIVTFSANCFIGSSPKFKNFEIPLRIPAALISVITSAKTLTPSKADLSIPLKVFTNVLRLSAISGNPDVVPEAKPPTIFPKNEPKPYPSFSRIWIPPSRNF